MTDKPMTGPEHFRRADSIMRQLAEASDEGANLSFAQVQGFLAQAHVHATLALAAATALGAQSAMPDCDSQEWFKTVTCATGEEPTR